MRFKMTKEGSILLNVFRQQWGQRLKPDHKGQKKLFVKKKKWKKKIGRGKKSFKIYYRLLRFIFQDSSLLWQRLTCTGQRRTCRALHSYWWLDGKMLRWFHWSYCTHPTTTSPKSCIHNPNICYYYYWFSLQYLVISVDKNSLELFALCNPQLTQILCNYWHLWERCFKTNPNNFIY